MSYRITLIPGDGVGPQIVEASRRVIDASGVPIEWEVVEAGEALIPQYGTPLPQYVLDSIQKKQGSPERPPDHTSGKGIPQCKRDPAPGTGPLRQRAPG